MDPCALLFRRRAFCLDGYALEAREYRMFRAGRIEEVKILPIRIPVREDYSLSGCHAGAFSVFPGEKSSRVRVKFDPSIAPFIRESLWHPSQSLTGQPAGGLILEVDVAEPREVGWWVLQWGAGAEILSPRALRGEIAREAARLHHRYAEGDAAPERPSLAAEGKRPYRRKKDSGGAAGAV